MIHSYFLSHGSSLTVSTSRSSTSEKLMAVVGGGRGCVLEADGPVAGIWIPLRGRLHLGGGSGDAIVRGELGITEAEPNLRAVGRGNTLWVALLGGNKAWHGVLDNLSEIPIPDPLLLPARHPADIGLRRRALALARAAAKGRADTAADSLIESVFTLQNEFTAAIDRCPGRTYAQRRQVFIRLQRVRNFVMANCHLTLDNDGLAQIANYSPWQFIRAFRSTYRQTPHAFVVDQRLQRARRLLSSSPLSIAEVAAASGFEDRCSFSRLFSERFGVTARGFRREAGHGARMVA